MSGDAKNQLDGKRVTILGNHPWSGHSGVVAGVPEQTLIGWILTVNLDNGMSAGVTNLNQIRVEK